MSLTVKGLFTLAADYAAEAGALWEGTEVWGAEEWTAYHTLQHAAARCRRKAYDLLGVVTIDAAQLPLVNREGDVLL